MDCRKCKFFVFVRRKPYMDRGYHYCDRLTHQVLATQHSRKSVCGGKYFEPKQDN